MCSVIVVSICGLKYYPFNIAHSRASNVPQVPNVHRPRRVLPRVRGKEPDGRCQQVFRTLDRRGLRQSKYTDTPSPSAVAIATHPSFSIPWSVNIKLPNGSDWVYQAYASFQVPIDHGKLCPPVANETNAVTDTDIPPRPRTFRED